MGHCHRAPTQLLMTHNNINEITNRKFVTATSVRLNQKTNDDDGDEDIDMDDFMLNHPLPIAPEGAPSDTQIKSDTMQWIQNVVIGLNLCPFADKPFRSNQLQVHVIRGTDDQMIAAEVLYRMMHHKQQPGTTVVVAPEYHVHDFESYLSMITYLEEDVMVEYDLHGIVQLAPFHPQFIFQGTDKDDVDNLTNRAPYPSFHILREEEVSKAVQKLHGDSSKVWNRNVRLLKNLQKAFGREKVERIIRGGGDKEVEGIDLVLKQTKEEMENMDNNDDDENNKDQNDK